MKRVALFGGSFNPIHKGHLALAKELCDKEELDEFWFMVSPMNPFKQNMELLDDNTRLELVKLAIADDARLVACDFEFSLPRPSYTYHTLQALKEAFPDTQFILIIGGDNWVKFPHWYKSKEILEMVDVWVYPRPGYNTDPITFPEHVRQISAPLFNYSSTDVRAAIKAHQDASDMLPAAVWEKIKEEHIYCED